MDMPLAAQPVSTLSSFRQLGLTFSSKHFTNSHEPKIIYIFHGIIPQNMAIYMNILYENAPFFTRNAKLNNFTYFVLKYASKFGDITSTCLMKHGKRLMQITRRATQFIYGVKEVPDHLLTVFPIDITSVYQTRHLESGPK